MSGENNSNGTETINIGGEFVNRFKAESTRFPEEQTTLALSADRVRGIFTTEPRDALSPNTTLERRKTLARTLREIYNTTNLLHLDVEETTPAFDSQTRVLETMQGVLDTIAELTDRPSMVTDIENAHELAAGYDLVDIALRTTDAESLEKTNNQIGMGMEIALATVYMAQTIGNELETLTNLDAATGELVTDTDPQYVNSLRQAHTTWLQAAQVFGTNAVNAKKVMQNKNSMLQAATTHTPNRTLYAGEKTIDPNLWNQANGHVNVRGID